MAPFLSVRIHRNSITSQLPFHTFWPSLSHASSHSTPQEAAHRTAQDSARHWMYGCKHASLRDFFAFLHSCIPAFLRSWSPSTRSRSLFSLRSSLAALTHSLHSLHSLHSPADRCQGRVSTSQAITQKAEKTTNTFVPSRPIHPSPSLG